MVYAIKNYALPYFLWCKTVKKKKGFPEIHITYDYICNILYSVVSQGGLCYIFCYLVDAYLCCIFCYLVNAYGK